MQFTTIKELYSINNSNETIKLQGELTLSSESIQINGNFQLVDGTFVGHFNYRELGTTLDKNFGNLIKSNQEDALALLDETIEELKLELEL